MFYLFFFISLQFPLGFAPKKLQKNIKRYFFSKNLFWWNAVMHIQIMVSWKLNQGSSSFFESDYDRETVLNWSQDCFSSIWVRFPLVEINCKTVEHVGVLDVSWRVGIDKADGQEAESEDERDDGQDEATGQPQHQGERFQSGCVLVLFFWPTVSL